MSSATSPCVGVCTIDPAHDICRGCGRSLDEIVAWGGSSETQRLAIMRRLPGGTGSLAPRERSVLDARTVGG